MNDLDFEELEKEHLKELYENNRLIDYEKRINAYNKAIPYVIGAIILFCIIGSSSHDDFYYTLAFIVGVLFYFFKPRKTK